jgi:hypothetical protein
MHGGIPPLYHISAWNGRTMYFLSYTNTTLWTALQITITLFNNLLCYFGVVEYCSQNYHSWWGGVGTFTHITNSKRHTFLVQMPFAFNDTNFSSYMFKINVLHLNIS